MSNFPKLRSSQVTNHEMWLSLKNKAKVFFFLIIDILDFLRGMLHLNQHYGLFLNTVAFSRT